MTLASRRWIAFAAGVATGFAHLNLQVTITMATEVALLRHRHTIYRDMWWAVFPFRSADAYWLGVLLNSLLSAAVVTFLFLSLTARLQKQRKGRSTDAA